MLQIMTAMPEVPHSVGGQWALDVFVLDQLNITMSFHDLATSGKSVGVL